MYVALKLDTEKPNCPSKIADSRHGNYCMWNALQYLSKGRCHRKNFWWVGWVSRSGAGSGGSGARSVAGSVAGSGVSGAGSGGSGARSGGSGLGAGSGAGSGGCWVSFFS